MRGIWFLLFAILAGFTASGIAANLYRIVGPKPDTKMGWSLRAISMTIAGPSVFFESAMRNYLAKEWQPLTFWLVTGGILYWSFALGLFVIDLAMAL